jgi:hypothetical protein
MMVAKKNDRAGIENQQPEDKQNSSEFLNQNALDLVNSQKELAIGNLNRIESLPDTTDKRFMVDEVLYSMLDLRKKLELASTALIGEIAEIDKVIANADRVSTELYKKEYKPVKNLEISDLIQFRIYQDILAKYSITTTDELFDAITNEYSIHDELFSKLKRADMAFLSSKLAELNYKFPE